MTTSRPTFDQISRVRIFATPLHSIAPIFMYIERASSISVGDLCALGITYGPEANKCFRVIEFVRIRVVEQNTSVRTQIILSANRARAIDKLDSLRSNLFFFLYLFDKPRIEVMFGVDGPG